jgi:hypothetical protein
MGKKPATREIASITMVQISIFLEKQKDGKRCLPS